VQQEMTEGGDVSDRGASSGTATIVASSSMTSASQNYLRCQMLPKLGTSNMDKNLPALASERNNFTKLV
jgi:hypothetical protein